MVLLLPHRYHLYLNLLKLTMANVQKNDNVGLRPHFVLVPLLAQGHIIPMVDLARVIAARGHLVSLITTPVNADRIRSVINRVKATELPVRFVELQFPCAEAGLPEGVENIDLVPSNDLYKPFFLAISLLSDPLESYLRETTPSPSCIVTDFCNFFTADIARKLCLPRIIFHGPSCFFILCMYNAGVHKVYDGKDENELVELPNMPRRVETTKAQAPGWFPGPDWVDIREKAIEAEASADAVVVNTFYGLEPEIIDHYKKSIAKPVWSVGPLSLSNTAVDSKASRGKKSSVDEGVVLRWLDAKEQSSVVYVSFGSLIRTKPALLIELGWGLEASNRPFIWVIKEADNSPELKKWMSEGGFKERTQERGLVIIGWAPQTVILSHPSVGGFVTHCGWNSITEAVSAGVPMITWPHFADQFINEKLVVEVLKVGVAVGVTVPYYHIKEGEVPVKREEVEKAVARLMDGGEEAEEMRERIVKLAEEAGTAMEEGGSSHENLGLFIQYIMQHIDD